MTQSRFDHLVALLKKLFQLDKPDLDFGFYRIMHAKGDEVTEFLERDLLPQVKKAFSRYESADRTAVAMDLEAAEASARDLGADPDELPKVRELRERLDAATDVASLEADVYDHLYRFFRRYYSKGDFLSKRVYKDNVYAIPYQGEEVKLHWANSDQYYIKTTEHLRDYSFRLSPDNESDPMRVHFRLVDATEGEHGNVKARADQTSRFILAEGEFMAVEEGDDGVEELIIRFVYRPATASDLMDGQRLPNKGAPKQSILTDAATMRILDTAQPRLRRWIASLAAIHVKPEGTQAHYSRLRAHLNRYTARNTFDYFIHKDLGGFLRRELDFYIKNEIVHLDDIDDAKGPRVEEWLSKIKVIRFIAYTIIDFLAQLENFQKKLWLKKKFVVGTSYCVTLGRIPDKFHEEIAANRAQHDEWVDLLSIDDSENDLTRPRYSRPLTLDFLKAYPTLMVDTKHFSEDFTARLLEAIGDIDDHTDGVLFHSENFQALRLMEKRYQQQIKCIYIDPLYNTEKDRSQGKFLYKDGYAYSSWIAMISERARTAWPLLSEDGGQYTSIDDVMYADLKLLMSQAVGRSNHIATVIWQKVHTRKNSARHFSVSHDYVVLFARSKDHWDRVLLPRSDTSAYANPDRDPRGPWKPDPVYANNPYDEEYTIQKPNRVVLSPPVGQYWRFSEKTWKEKVRTNAVVWGSETGYPMVKRFLADVQDGLVPVTLFDRTFAGDNAKANSELDGLFGSSRPFSYPKPSLLLERLFQTSVRPGRGEWILDYFAGSGTAAHAVIGLNRRDGDRRRFVLVEMADYFDTVLVPRIKKITFAPTWLGGKPKALATPSEAKRSCRVVKIVRLESYEDTLNNLVIHRTQAQEQLFNGKEADESGFREEYLIRYMLDVETGGSASLLNIGEFADPTTYLLKVKRPGSDESREVAVDLVETFNWLVGLRASSMARPRRYSATLGRDGEGRLVTQGAPVESSDGEWWFRAIEGLLPDDRRALIIWRNRPSGNEADGIEQDNAVLNGWFAASKYAGGHSRFDLVYVNGDHSLEALRPGDGTWTARVIEDHFRELMFEGDDGAGPW